MIFNRYRDLFETCAPLFWPWLWLQLAALLALKAEDGRERLIMVTWWGQVTVLAVGDAQPIGATGTARPAPHVASYHALLSARFPGDALHTGMPSDAAPCAPLCHAMPAQTPVFQPNLADKSFVAPPG